ncbi:MAG TPA: amino acid carrier protein, partial [Myxococcaceae bacterium]|nr:amino acid carrier protein [Myxococcaceae bacterium]
MLPEFLRNAIDTASNAVWSPLTMALLLGTGVFLTVRLRFVQVTRFGEALRAMVPTQASGAGILSPFQAFMTALGASIGTGNIAGVATAIVSGGPGALFWIWVYGFFATTIKFCEAVLGIKYRVVQGDRVSAGPMHYLKDGLGSPKLAWAYAAIAGVAALTTTPFTQPNSIAVVLQSQFAIPPLYSGLGLAVLTWLVVIGGVKSIGRAAEKLAPLKVGLYLAGGLWVILFHAGEVPGVFALIFREAFSLEAAGGGAAGVGIMVAMRYGIARGIYANEAGYGTAAVAYGTARTEAPVQQGLQAVMEVFIVSCVTSTISALVILASGAWTSGLT